MAHAAATAQTWGISDLTFLLAYPVIALAVWVASTRARRTLADQRTTSPVDDLVEDLSGRPHDVAYLNGGSRLAVYSALGAVYTRGAVAVSSGSLRPVGRLDGSSPQLEQAILATAGPVHRQRLPYHRPVREALAMIEERLLSARLLLSPEVRRRIRHVGFWMLAVAVFGLVRVLADVAEARPDGNLLGVMVMVGVVAAHQLAYAPRRSRQGDQVLATLRRRHDSLSPAVKPDWQMYGPSKAALGVGLFGTRALWASAPNFAKGIQAPRVSAGGSDAGGGDGRG